MIYQTLPAMYIKFDGMLTIPDYISIGGNLIKADLEAFLQADGLVLPFMRSFPSSDIPKTYFGEPTFTGMTNMKYSVTIKPNGTMEELFVREKGNAECCLIPKEIKRLVIHDEYPYSLVLSEILLDAENIDEFLNDFERRFALSTKLFSIWSIDQLVKYINGELPFSKLTPKKAKSEFKTIWIK